MMVSAFSHTRGEILGVKVIENKKQSEIVAVQDLLELLDLKGVLFTMDALHCQKADATPRRRHKGDSVCRMSQDKGLVRMYAHQAKLSRQLSTVVTTT